MAKRVTKKTTKNRSSTGREVTQFKPGQSGNPSGRPLGARNRRTVIWDALKRIAEKKGVEPEDVEEAIQTAGIEKAIKGSYFHYQEISNGLYGKVTDKVDVTSGGMTLADLVRTANGTKRKSGTKTTRANTRRA